MLNWKWLLAPGLAMLPLFTAPADAQIKLRYAHVASPMPRRPSMPMRSRNL